MDLDPGPGVDWPEVIEAAGEVRKRLGEAGLASFVKTSGGKGLHVVAPLQPRAGWDEVQPFAKSLADAMAADAPDRFVADPQYDESGQSVSVGVDIGVGRHHQKKTKS